VSTGALVGGGVELPGVFEIRRIFVQSVWDVNLLQEVATSVGRFPSRRLREGAGVVAGAIRLTARGRRAVFLISQQGQSGLAFFASPLPATLQPGNDLAEEEQNEQARNDDSQHQRATTLRLAGRAVAVANRWRGYGDIFEILPSEFVLPDHAGRGSLRAAKDHHRELPIGSPVNGPRSRDFWKMLNDSGTAV